MAIKTLLCPSCLKPMRARSKGINTEVPDAEDGPNDTVLDLSISDAMSAPPVPEGKPPREPGALRLSGITPAAQIADPEAETAHDLPVGAPPPPPEIPRGVIPASPPPPSLPDIPRGVIPTGRPRPTGGAPPKGTPATSSTRAAGAEPQVPKGTAPRKAAPKATPRKAAPKAAPPKAAAPKAAAPKAAAPKGASPKAAAPKAAPPKAATPKAASSRPVAQPSGAAPSSSRGKGPTTAPRLALHTPTRQPRPRTGTAPEVMIAHVRQDITHTGIGVVRGVPTTVVGREHELRKLMDAYKRVREEGRPQIAVIRGATGNGKTRIVLELLESLRLSQYPFLLLTNLTGSRTPEQSDHIIQRLVASRFRLNRDLPNSARRKELLSRIRSVFPRENVAEATVAFGHLLGIRFPFSDTLAPLFRRIHEDPAYFEQLVLRLLHQMLSREADARPTILWCDNFDYEHYEGQQHIAELLPAIAERPVLVLLAVQNELPSETLEQLRQHTPLEPLDVHLAELSREDCAELVRDILRLVEALPDIIVELIVEKSGGVPLVVEHMVRMLIDHGVIEQGELTWTAHPERLESVPNLPETIEGLARARIANVSPDERFVLQLAALMGNQFRLDDILKIVRFMPFEDEQPWFDNRRESWLREVILELLGRDIVVLTEAEASDAESFQFTYPIERSFVLEAIDPLFAQWVHGCHARVLVERGGALDHIAWHFETAGLTSEAATYWRALALEEREAGNLPTAVDALHRAVSISGPQYGSSYLDNILDLSRLLIHTGSFHVAEQFIAQMLQCAYAFQDAPRSVLAYTEHAHALFCLGALEQAHDACQRGLDLALRFNESGAVVACAHERLARITLAQGEAGACSESLRLLETALEMRRVEDEPLGIVDTLLEMGMVRICRAEMNRALAAFTEALALCRGEGSTLGLCRTLGAFSTMHRTMQRLDLSRRHALEALSVGGEQIDLLTEFELRSTLGLLGIAREDFGEAMNSLQRAAALAERSQNDGLLAENACHWSELYFSMEDYETAAEHAEQAVIRARSGESKLALGVSLRALARAQALMLRHRAAKISVRGVRDVFLEALSLVEEMGNWHETAATLHAYGEFLIDRGKRPEGQRCIQRAAKLDPKTTQAREGA